MFRSAAPLLVLATTLATALGAQGPRLDEVEAALRDGQYWRATELLQPFLDSDATPEVTIAAARAAAGWEGWPTVRRLLERQPWLDSRFDRLGRRLLADAALAEDRPSDALSFARQSLPGTVYPRPDEEAARRWLALARAHERLGAWDSAAAAYTRAAARFPELSDWLALRAAGVTADSVARARLYSTVTLPAAQARIGWTEALAWTRLGEKARAARSYAALGSTATALRLRWEADSDRAARGRVGTALVALVREGRDRGEARQALAILDDYRVPMARGDSLAIAHRAAELGRPQYAVAFFTALARGGALATRDRLAWGDAEASRGNWQGAEARYRSITTGPLAGRAAYQAARAQLRQGQVRSATGALARIPARFPDDTFAAGTALYLLADLALDAASPDSARGLLIRLARDYPDNEFAPRAALIAPLIAFAQGEPATAANELRAAIATRRLTGFDADAATYWIGRAELARARADEARATFRTLLDRGPENYYALKAAARLDTMPWRLPAASAPEPVVPLDGLRRADLLSQLGLDFEAGLELDAVAAAATTRQELIAAGSELLAHGHPSRARTLGQRLATMGGERDGDTWRLLYVLPYAGELRASAEAAGLDPWLVAAVIRQESAFEPRARSAADARGLMQLLPGSGRDLARSLGIRDFDPALLWQPGLNLAMGTRHFAKELGRYPERERSLAAYNAGPGRVAQWSRTLLDGSAVGDGGLADPELFVERIPYLETRNYIRRITVNETIYRMLYEPSP